MPEPQKSFAVLIDGDNVNAKKIEEILNRVNLIGKILIKNVYHNKASLEHWEPVIGKYSLTPIWVPNNTRKKNSVDIALVVDAMSLLYERPGLEGFCIVSSDADFTALVKHIQTKDKYVLGIGTDGTPEPFRNACTEFVDIEKIVSAESPVEQFFDPVEAVSTPIEEITDYELLNLFSEAYKTVAKRNTLDSAGGWVQLLDVKAVMVEINPEFQPNTRALAERLKALAQAFPRSIEVHEQLESKPVLHQVRLPEGEEIDRFRAAYEHAVNMSGDKDGWVQLSAFGQALQVLYSDSEPIEYKGVAKLQKVIKKMSMDYPNIIELNTEGNLSKVRFRTMFTS